MALLAGTGRADITPAPGTPHAGWGAQTHQRGLGGAIDAYLRGKKLEKPQLLTAASPDKMKLEWYKPAARRALGDRNDLLVDAGWLVHRTPKEAIALTAASLHLNAFMRRSVFVEFNVTSGPLSREICRNPISMRDGYIDVPQGPGLGVEVDESALAKYRVQ